MQFIIDPSHSIHSTSLQQFKIHETRVHDETIQSFETNFIFHIMINEQYCDLSTSWFLHWDKSNTTLGLRWWMFPSVMG